jgi:hypothetical protein
MVTGVPPGIKQLGREAEHSPPSSPEFKNVCSYTSTPPVSMAERSKANTVFGRSNIGIASSNPARGMDVCLCFSVLCCPV